MLEIGVRALCAQLSRVLTRVQSGEEVVITSGGKRVARIAPIRETPRGSPPSLAELIASGRATWGGGDVSELPEPALLVGDGPTATELILRERAESLGRLLPADER